MRRDFYNKQLGKKHNILFESENKKGFIFGFTENYVRVKTNWDYKLVNKVSSFRLHDICEDGFVILKKLEKLATV